MNPLGTPKQQFLKDETATRFHNDLLNHSSFVPSTRMALLQHVELSLAKYSADPAAGFHAIKGASDFLETLISLSIKPNLPNKPTVQSLDHTA